MHEYHYGEFQLSRDEEIRYSFESRIKIKKEVLDYAKQKVKSEFKGMATFLGHEPAEQMANQMMESLSEQMIESLAEKRADSMAKRIFRLEAEFKARMMEAKEEEGKDVEFYAGYMHSCGFEAEQIAKFTRLTYEKFEELTR